MEKRLLEDSLPLKEISAWSAKEKLIRHEHISAIFYEYMESRH